MGIDYEKISKNYDSVRYANQSTISVFLQNLHITEATKVLDFGCGSGNYADTLQKATHAQVFGVEPSDGMREKAVSKNSSVVFSKGNHGHIPFEDNFFDFVYMTDVIHHIPDLGVMFRELFRVLKKEGFLCIVTQSHEQIDKRFYVKYFPTTAIVDKHRYPDIPVIIGDAVKAGFSHIRTNVKEGGITKVQSDFVELARAKGYSMFHLIPEEEYQKGLTELEKDVMTDALFVPDSSGTLVWLGK